MSKKNREDKSPANVGVDMEGVEKGVEDMKKKEEASEASWRLDPPVSVSAIEIAAFLAAIPIFQNLPEEFVKALPSLDRLFKKNGE